VSPGLERHPAGATSLGERATPKVLHFISFNEFDAVAQDSVSGAHLCDHSGRSLRPAIVSNDNCRTDLKLAVQQDGGSVSVQVRGFRTQRETTFLAVFPGQAHGQVESNAPAPALQNRVPIGDCGSQLGQRSCAYAEVITLAPSAYTHN
jgi:hypothetical protein